MCSIIYVTNIWAHLFSRTMWQALCPYSESATQNRWSAYLRSHSSEVVGTEIFNFLSKSQAPDCSKDTPFSQHSSFEFISWRNRHVGSGKKTKRKNREGRGKELSVCVHVSSRKILGLSSHLKKWCFNACRHLTREWQACSTDKSIGNILTRM